MCCKRASTPMCSQPRFRIRRSRARSAQTCCTQTPPITYPVEVIERIAGKLVHSFSTRCRADLVSEFAQPLSLGALKHRLGITISDETLLGWSNGLAAGASNFMEDPERQARADAAGREIDEELRCHLNDPRKNSP